MIQSKDEETRKIVVTLWRRLEHLRTRLVHCFQPLVAGLESSERTRRFPAVPWLITDCVRGRDEPINAPHPSTLRSRGKGSSRVL